MGAWGDTVGEGDGGEIKCGIEASGIKEKGIDIGIGKLIDEDGEAEITAIVEKMTEESSLAATEEAGDKRATHTATSKAGTPVEHSVFERQAHLVPLHFF